MARVLSVLVLSACGASQPAPAATSSTTEEPYVPEWQKREYDAFNTGLALTDNAPDTAASIVSLNNYRNTLRSEPSYTYHAKDDARITREIDEKLARVLPDLERRAATEPAVVARDAHRLAVAVADPTMRTRLDALRAVGATWHAARAAKLAGTHPLAARLHAVLALSYGGGPNLPANAAERDRLLGPTVTVKLIGPSGDEPCSEAEELKKRVPRPGANPPIEAVIRINECLVEMQQSTGTVSRAETVKIVDHVDKKEVSTNCITSRFPCHVRALPNSNLEYLECVESYTGDVQPMKYCGRFKGENTVVEVPVMKDVVRTVGVPTKTVTMTKTLKGYWSVGGPEQRIEVLQKGTNTTVQGDPLFGTGPSFEPIVPPIIDAIWKAAGIVDYEANVPVWLGSALKADAEHREDDAEEAWVKVALGRPRYEQNPLYGRYFVSWGDVWWAFEAQGTQAAPAAVIKQPPR